MPMSLCRLINQLARDQRQINRFRNELKIEINKIDRRKNIITLKLKGI